VNSPIEYILSFLKKFVHGSFGNMKLKYTISNI